jgi:hypothetical protein
MAPTPPRSWRPPSSLPPGWLAGFLRLGSREDGGRRRSGSSGAQKRGESLLAENSGLVQEKERLRRQVTTLLGLSAVELAAEAVRGRIEARVEEARAGRLAARRGGSAGPGRGHGRGRCRHAEPAGHPGADQARRVAAGTSRTRHHLSPTKTRSVPPRLTSLPALPDANTSAGFLTVFPKHTDQERDATPDCGQS